jgi:hypothetical protein
MKRISSQWTFFYKRIFPMFWFGFLGLFVLTAFSTSRSNAMPYPLLVVPVVMAVLGFILFRKLIFDLVDEVWDDGDALIVKNGGVEERVPLTNIMNIGYSTMTNPPRVTLTLRDPGAFGKEITFSPPVRVLGFSRHPIIGELIERVDRARRG